MSPACPTASRAVNTATPAPPGGNEPKSREAECHTLPVSRERAKPGPGSAAGCGREQRCTITAHGWGQADRSHKAGRAPHAWYQLLGWLLSPGLSAVCFSPVILQDRGDPAGLPPCPWPWFLPSWGDFAALLLDAEMLKQEEPLAPAAGWLLQLLSCSGDPALLDHH